MTCVVTPTPDQSLSITFPGGARLQTSIHGAGPPSQLELAKALLGQAGPVLAGLKPLFNIIGALTAILELAQAIPSVIVAPDDVIEATGKLAQKIDGLLQVVPQLSVPLLILGIIDTVLAALVGIEVELTAAEAQLARCAAAEAAAAALPEGVGRAALLEAATCARTNVAAQLTNLQNGLGPLNEMMTLASSIGALAGLPPLGSVSSLGTDPTAAKASLVVVTATLTTLRQAIPV